MWKFLIAVLALAMMTTVAAAQTFIEMPNTVPFNDENGNQIGTAAISSTGIYIRDLKGEFIASIKRDREGRLTIYDPNGKILDQLPAPQK